MTLPIAIAVVDLLVVTILIALRMEVRLVLIAASVPLFASSSGLKAMCSKLVTEMANPGTVVPICSALGFAYVMRLTECDQHLVRLLLRPLNRFRMLLIPGGIAAGYLVNTTIVSQTGTAAVLGPILIPLLRAGGLAPATAGAILLLGSSMGGELFNPGAVEMRKLAELTALSGPTVVARASSLNLLACGTALLSFWTLSRLRPGHHDALDPEAEKESPGGSVDFHIDPIKAIVPVVPLVLLFADSSLGVYSPLRSLDGPPKILAAMLIGIILAGRDLDPGRRAARHGVLRGSRLRLHARDLADRRRVDLRRGNPPERPDRDDGQGADRLANRVAGREHGRPLGTRRRLRHGDRPGGVDHGVLRAGRRDDGPRPGSPGHGRRPRLTLRPDHEPGRRGGGHVGQAGLRPAVPVDPPGDAAPRDRRSDAPDRHAAGALLNRHDAARSQNCCAPTFFYAVDRVASFAATD